MFGAYMQKLATMTSMKKSGEIPRVTPPLVLLLDFFNLFSPIKTK